MLRCVYCQTRAAVVELSGNLCDDCGGDLAPPVELMPEHIISAADTGGAALIDAWGRPHYLEDRTPIGRVVGRRGVSVLHASVSRDHAVIERDGSTWMIADTGSTNGTLVAGELVEREALGRIADVSFGSVSFYFISDSSGLQMPDHEPAKATVKPDERRAAAQAPLDDQTFTGLPEVRISLVEPTGGGGGILEIGGVRVQLASTQFELIALLVERMSSESHQPELVRGFVRSSELLGSISWDTPTPTENHVKQLVRRVRRTLVRADIGNLIEARHRFGYRVRLIPKR